MVCKGCTRVGYVLWSIKFFHKHEEIYLKGGYNGFENENGCVFH